MRQKIFLNPINLNVSKHGLGLGVSHTRVAYRLRGVWRYAQDTVPIWACFFNNLKELRTLGSVGPLSTIFKHQKIVNKYSGVANHG